MPLHPRSVSVSISIVCLFMISFIGWFAGLSPFTCCKRAIVGAVVAYIVTKITVNMINRILMSALVESELKKQQGIE